MSATGCRCILKKRGHCTRLLECHWNTLPNEGHAKASPSYRICLPPKLTNNIWEMSVRPPRQMAETKEGRKEGNKRGGRNEGGSTSHSDNMIQRNPITILRVRDTPTLKKGLIFFFRREYFSHSKGRKADKNKCGVN